LHGSVRAPASAGPGSAIAKVSFDAWREGQVAATNHTISVQPPKAGPKSEVVSDRLIRTLVHPNRKANVISVRFTPNGSLYAAGDSSAVIQMFDPASGKELYRIESPPGSAENVEPTRDCGTVYVPTARRKVIRVQRDGKEQPRIEFDGELLAWDLLTGKQRPALKPSAPGRGLLAAFVDPTGTRIVTVEQQSQDLPGRQPDELVLWDLKTGTPRILGSGYAMAAFSGDGSRLAVTFLANKDNPSRLIVLDPATGKEQFSIKSTQGGVRLLWPTFSPDGAWLVVVESAGRNRPGTLKLFDAATGEQRAAFASTGDFPFLAPHFSPDSKRLAATDYKGTLTIWDLASRKVERTHTFEKMRTGFYVAYSPDGRRLAVFAMAKDPDLEKQSEPDPQDFAQPRVFLFDLSQPSAKPVELVCPHGFSGGLAFSRDSRMLAAGSTGAIHLFDVSER
jgi:WD40 repeat protein